MRILLRGKIWLSAAVLVVMSFSTITAHAHEGQEAGDYNINIGWIKEPTYEGFRNGVELRVTRNAAEDDAMPEEASDGTKDDAEVGHDESGETKGGDAMLIKEDHGSEVGVTGLEQTLRVEVTHTATAASTVLDLRADKLKPGRYTSDPIIPTVPGVYEFRVFGEVDGIPVDEVFSSRGAGGGFDDVRPATSIQFPEALPSLRELDSAVRGAGTTAETALDASLAAQATAAAVADAVEGGSTALTLATVAIVLGAVGTSLGAAGIVLARVKK